MSLTFLPIIQFFDDSGKILNGGLLYFWKPGTSTPKTVYKDAAGATPHTNPIELDAAGRALIYISGVYDIDIKKSTGVLVKSIPGVSDISSFISSNSEWLSSGMTPTYLSATTFSVPGDQTSILTVPRKLQFVCAAGTLYGTITASSFASSITTVTVVLDSGNLDSGLSSFKYGLYNYTNPTLRKVPILDHGTKSTDFALDMCRADVHIVAFSGAATLTISSSLTSDKSTIIIKNGNNAITLAGIDNNSPTLTTAASKKDVITLEKSFGTITCISTVLNEATT